MKVSHANERFRRLDLGVAVVYTSKVPIHLYVYTSIHLYITLYIHASIYKSIHLYIYRRLYNLYIHTSIHPYISKSLHLDIYTLALPTAKTRDLLSSHTCSKVQRDFFPSSWPSRPFCSLSRPNTFAAVPTVDGVVYRRCRRLGSSQFAVNGVSWAVAKRMLAATQPR